jgi:predicted nucleic acid-binding Zn ribbon protein
MARKNRLEWIRKAVLREWRGGDEPERLDARVHAPGEFLATILRDAGADEGIDEERLRAVWGRVAGEMVARHTSPDSLKRGCLTLKVLQPAMRFQLEQMKGRLLRNLRAELGEDVVKSIRFSLG